MKIWQMLSILLVLSLAQLAWAEDEDISRIVVTGDGTSKATPDMVTLTLGVETRDESAVAAAAENAELMNRTIEALIDAGVERREIQTTGYSISRYEPDPDLYDGGDETPVFVVINQVTIALNLTEDVEAVLDAAIDAGSNKVTGLAFGIRDPSPYMDEALEEAVQDAISNAHVVASAAGVELGPILEITEGYSYQPTRAMADFAFSQTLVMPGELEMSASVTMTYAIAE